MNANSIKWKEKEKEPSVEYNNILWKNEGISKN